MRLWLQIIRWPNLIIVAITMYVLHFKLVLPSSEDSQIAESISNLDFYLLILMTLFATAAGYVINDWFDYKIDLVNKPNKVIINKKITWRTARRLYLSLIVLGAFLSSYLSSKLGLWGITILYNSVCVLLFLYARLLKKYFLIGNIVVSLLCGFIPLLVWYVNQVTVMTSNSESLLALYLAQSILIAFTAFSFLVTLFREIVKDIEDIDGDKKYDARTVPIVSGITTAKIIAGTSGVFILLGIWSLKQSIYQYRELDAFFLGGIGLSLLQIWSLFLLYRAKEKEQFAKLSLVLKGCMFLGLLWLMLY